MTPFTHSIGSSNIFPLIDEVPQVNSTIFTNPFIPTTIGALNTLPYYYHYKYWNSHRCPAFCPQDVCLNCCCVLLVETNFAHCAQYMKYRMQ